MQRSDLEPGGGFQFGAVDAAVIYLLPEILKEYMRRYPGVALKTQVAPSRYLIDDLLTQRSEFALIHLPYTHPKIDAVPIYRDDMPLVVGPAHRFARCESVALAEVVEEPLILFHADSISRKVIDEKLAEAGLSPGAVMELRSPEAMRKLVEAGVGISFLPRLTIRESLASGALKTVEVRGVAFEREIGVAWRRGRYFGQAVRLLLEARVCRLRRAGRVAAKDRPEELRPRDIATIRTSGVLIFNRCYAQAPRYGMLRSAQHDKC